MKDLPLVLTLGEPAGVGLEISLKACRELKGTIPFFVIGDFEQIKHFSLKFGVQITEIKDPSETLNHKNNFCVLDHKFPEKISPGRISFKNSPSVISVIRRAVNLIHQGKASGLITCPINKWVLKRGADFQFPGHTEFLAKLDNKSGNVVMMLADNNSFRVIPTTIHIPLKHVPEMLTKELLSSTLKTLVKGLKIDCGIFKPKILVTGLNPHAGENSTLGKEEQATIVPVIDELKRNGYSITGPVSADTAFTSQNRSLYDAFVCMYHDQALIPIKTLNFYESVNVTLGLSFIRTSPDHGTALDIATKNIANPGSLISAIVEANKIKKNRLKNENKA